MKGEKRVQLLCFRKMSETSKHISLYDVSMLLYDIKYVLMLGKCCLFYIALYKRFIYRRLGTILFNFIW